VNYFSDVTQLFHYLCNYIWQSFVEL